MAQKVAVCPYLDADEYREADSSRSLVLPCFCPYLDADEYREANGVSYLGSDANGSPLFCQTSMKQLRRLIAAVHLFLSVP